MSWDLSPENFLKLKKLNLLLLLLSFEKYWHSYSLSDGQLYAKAVRNEVKKIIPLYYEIYGKNTLINSEKTINENLNFDLRQFIEELEKWVDTNDKFPKVLLGKEYTSRFQYLFQVVLMVFETQLEEEIKLPIPLEYTALNHEGIFREKICAKWAGQMPEVVIKNIGNPSYILNMSKSDTIVMVADIRRSQDLITYSPSPNTYREQIIGFLSEVRRILKEDYAIYDRFTGDGFIAYFNQFVCEQEGKDYYEMTLDACRRIQSFSENFFKKWSSLIRKIPVEPIGLSIGIDSGYVDFKDVDNQFFAIGDACVWATRMCNAGKRGDVIFNNIPYHQIVKYGAKGFSTEIDAETKNGESFKAYKVNPALVNYNARPKKDPSLNTPSAID